MGSHFSDFLRYDNCRYLLPCAFAFITPMAYPPSGQINGSQYGTLTFYGQVCGPILLRGSPDSLRFAGHYITRVLGPGGLKSRRPILRLHRHKLLVFDPADYRSCKTFHLLLFVQPYAFAPFCDFLRMLSCSMIMKFEMYYGCLTWR